MCSQEQIGSKRDCYLLELRNHATSGHHPEHNYDVISEDVIRFADQHGLKKFTILGHSMGGRTAMVTACKYPDRVDGCISIDSAPVDESGPSALDWLPLKMLELMHSFSDQGLTRSQAIQQAKEFYDNKPELVFIIDKNLKRNKDDKLEWLVNIDSLYKNFQEVPYFDESLTNDTKSVYHIVGEQSKIYEIDQYKKVFPNQLEDNVVIVKDAGHWVHFDQPEITIEHISNFIDEIDAQNSK